MATTVCIIGAGELGGSVADALARAERVDRVLIVDEAAPVASGKALDIQQSLAIEGIHTRLEGTGDFSRVTACAVCVLADRMGRPSSEWQGEDALALVKRLDGYLGSAPIVCAGIAQAGVIRLASREAGISRDVWLNAR